MAWRLVLFSGLWWVGFCLALVRFWLFFPFVACFVWGFLSYIFLGHLANLVLGVSVFCSVLVGNEIES